MGNQVAQEFLYRLRSCRPRSFFGRVDEIQKGTGFILNYLDESEGEVAAGDLARELNVSTARIAALLKKMEKNGLITRSGSPADARKTIVALTPAGQAFLDERRREILGIAEILIEKVGKEDLDEFIRICEKIKEALEQ